MKRLTLLLLLVPFLSGAQNNVTEKNGLYLDSNGKPFTGTYQEYFENGQVKSQMEIVQGLLNGQVKVYFPSGELNEIRSYIKGEKSGRWETWNAQGVKVAEANFLNGKKNGKWYVWDEKGTLRYDMTYRMW